jgi:hypothetical protein
MELFTIEENQVIIRPELRLIPQFKKIITRDKDRYKRQALLELAYIYYMYDYKSPYMNISDIDRHDQIIRHLQLGENWTPDPDIKDATQQYLEFQESPSIKALKSTKNALLNASKVIDVMNSTVEEALSDENNKDMVTAIETVDKLLSLADKLPKTINTIVTLEEKVQKEQHENSKVRGGGKAGAYEA